MNASLKRLQRYLEEERKNGNAFPQGAVLCTVSKDGVPRSRVVGTMFDDEWRPKFHTSPISRKVEDIKHTCTASLTYSFQNSLRSVSIEGILSPLGKEELDSDWMLFNLDFRKHYLAFGKISGQVIKSLDKLRLKRDSFVSGEEATRPESFIGYKFSIINRVSFYTVKDGDFAESLSYEKGTQQDSWVEVLHIP